MSRQNGFLVHQAMDNRTHNPVEAFSRGLETGQRAQANAFNLDRAPIEAQQRDDSIERDKQLQNMGMIGAAANWARGKGPEALARAKETLVGIVPQDELDAFTEADIDPLIAQVQGYAGQVEDQRYNEKMQLGIQQWNAEYGLAFNKANAPAKPPSGVQEYEYARSQGFEGTFQDWKQSTRQKGAGEGETAYAKERGKTFAGLASEIQASGRTAMQTKSRLADMKSALTGLQTGAGGNALQVARRAAAALGWEVKGTSEAEFVQSVANQMALQLRSPEGGAGMPGALSDKDRDFLVNMVPGLTKTPGGNMKIIEAFDRLAQRQIEVAELAAAYEQDNGRLDAGFDSLVAEYGAMAGDIFDDLAEGEQGSGIQAGAIAVTPDGQRRAYTGNGPSDDPANWVEVQ